MSDMEKQIIHSHRELIVWQKAMDLVTIVYACTENFPSSEMYGLTNQMRRAAVSIPCNIAEGRKRGSAKDYRQFLLIAYGSGAELETQLEIVGRLPFGKNIKLDREIGLLNEVMRMLNVMVTSLSSFPKKLKS